MALEFQNVFLSGLRRWLNTWCKFLDRTWGRGLLYAFTGFAHFSTGHVGGYVLGALLLALAAACWGVSRQASAKLGGLHRRIIAAHTDDLVYVRQVFNRLDVGGTGALSSAQLAAAAKELGSDFTPAELVAIFDYLDADFDGKLSYEEFEAFWTGRSSDVIAWDRIPVL